MLKGKHVLVTGADGFIGSHLTERLVREGAQVRAFTYYNSMGSLGWLDTLPEIRSYIEIFPGDIRDPNGVRRACSGVNVVFHLAALIGIPFSYHSPDTYIGTNIKGTLNVLQAARDLGVERVVHTSTSEVYGTAQFVPITEEHPVNAQSPYAASKAGADQLALSFFRSFGTQVSVIRPFNTYGPRQSARAVIPTIITQLLAGKDQLSLGALNTTRDFSFVEDTVSGFLSVGTHDAAVGKVFNVGSNFEISIADVVLAAAAELGRNADVVQEQARLRPDLSEVHRLWADNTKAREEIGWSPQYGGLEGFKKGLGKTIAWFKQLDNLRRYDPDIYQI